MRFPEDRVRHICNQLVMNHPDMSCDFYRMGISVEILKELVGNEWTNQAIFPNDHPVTSAAVKKAIAFLRTDSPSFQFQERVGHLAKNLYEVQSVPGLQRVIDSLKSGDIWLGYAEIEAGSFFTRRKIQCKFITPSGAKGNNFDLRLTEYAVNCEVKHKIEKTALSKDTLERTLSGAKSQVPPDEPALFFIKIPIEWVRSPGIKETLDRTKGTFFPRSPNIIGFILHWEEPSEQQDGLFIWKYRYEVNSSSVYKNDELARAMNSKAVDRNSSVVRMMNKYIKKCSDYGLV